MVEPEIIKAGDDAGNRMVIKYTGDGGVVVHGIGVPQAWETPLGPTWSYVVEGDHLTLIDTGCNGSLQHLKEGLEIVGYPLSAVDRIVVTHGHLDHDGNCFDVVKHSGAELWAHEVYSELLGINRWEKEMEWRRGAAGLPAVEDTEFVNRVQEYHRAQEFHKKSGGLRVDRAITDGLIADGLTFYYTPGHSPDELCILFERFLFSGDHILPQITPHPSVNLSYQSFQTLLPEAYRGQNTCYGLGTFMKSLKSVANLGNDKHVLPAHRAVNRGRFNLIGLERVEEILEHHRDRCHRLIDLIRHEPADLSTITQKHFPGLGPDKANFQLAYTEVVSHIEFLQESGDVEMAGKDDRLVRWNGTELFSAAIDAL